LCLSHAPSPRAIFLNEEFPSWAGKGVVFFLFFEFLLSMSLNYLTTPSVE
jgi:hypothetical protein